MVINKQHATNIKALKIVSGAEGDWTGLYVNGMLYHQGHSIPERVWCELLGFSHDEASEEIPQEAMEEMGELPADYREIQREATDQNAKVNLERLNR